MNGEAIVGKVKGYVRRNDDPENRGRLVLYVPQVMGPEDDAAHWTGWALPCLPWIGGLNTLDFGVPKTKAQNGGTEVGVWVEFENGNPDFPVWVGTFIPAPTATSEHAAQRQTDAEGLSGGSLLSNPPAGSSVEALLHPKPNTNEPETGMFVKEGRDLVFGSRQGGYLVIGPSGIHLVGVQVTANGKLIDANTSTDVIG